MPLGLIKKIAGKLLGQSRAKKADAPQARKPKKDARAHTPTPSERKSSGPASAERSRPSRNKPSSNDGQEGARKNRYGRKRPAERTRTVTGQPQDRTTSATARPVARPPRNKTPRRGQNREERLNTDASVRRPGGATGDAEQAARLAEHANWSIASYPVPEVVDKKRFQDFELPSEILHAVADLGFQYCTPIQALSLEHALAGKNVAGRAQTGTGKTAAFLVAILTRYLKSPEARHEKGGAPRALVIAPTRELVIQICKDAAALGKYCRLRSLAVYGGMDHERQRREVSSAPVDLLVATPGRLLDFVRTRVIDLSQVDTLVIDEADRMLDMGFIPDVRSIVNRLPPKEKRGTMLYSATLTEDVMRLALQWMEAPVKIEIDTDQVTTKSVKQIVYVVTADEKFTVLYNLIQQYPDSRMLIFCNRRSTTEDVADSLMRRHIQCEMLSGDVNQNRRLRVLEDFREGKIRIVVATDVAGRGLHVDDIGFVVNFDFPYEPEDYVHRIGRTGRAGASGTAISFADEDESFTIPAIEKYIGEELKCTVLKEEDALLAKLPPKPSRSRANQQREPPVHEAEREHPVSDDHAPQPCDVKDAASSHPSDFSQDKKNKPDVSPEPSTRPVEPKFEPRRHVSSPRAAVASTPREAKVSPQSRPTSAPTRRPRFSEEWVPGENSE